MAPVQRIGVLRPTPAFEELEAELRAACSPAAAMRDRHPPRAGWQSIALSVRDEAGQPLPAKWVGLAGPGDFGQGDFFLVVIPRYPPGEDPMDIAAGVVAQLTRAAPTMRVTELSFCLATIMLGTRPRREVVALRDLPDDAGSGAVFELLGIDPTVVPGLRDAAG